MPGDLAYHLGNALRHLDPAYPKADTVIGRTVIDKIIPVIHMLRGMFSITIDPLFPSSILASHNLPSQIDCANIAISDLFFDSFIFNKIPMPQESAADTVWTEHELRSYGLTAVRNQLELCNSDQSLMAYICGSLPNHLRSSLMTDLILSFGNVNILINKDTNQGTQGNFQAVHFSWYNRHATRNQALYEAVLAVFADLFEWIKEHLKENLPAEYEILIEVARELPCNSGVVTTVLLSGKDKVGSS
ncbi:hypothetical protein C8R48DRAFT_671478 [Suillus tomentosus]|nr:hypothetical protein C8R48DRAFT_671478 [Suillus tomentosus]